MVWLIWGGEAVGGQDTSCRASNLSQDVGEGKEAEQVNQSIAAKAPGLVVEGRTYRRGLGEDINPLCVAQ